MKLVTSIIFSTFLLFSSFYAAASDAVKNVNINTATAEQIAVVLDGIGMSKAMAIVDHRKRYGSFKQVESLEAVKGIGRSTVEKNRSKIRIN